MRFVGNDFSGTLQVPETYIIARASSDGVQASWVVTLRMVGTMSPRETPAKVTNFIAKKTSVSRGLRSSLQPNAGGAATDRAG